MIRGDRPDFIDNQDGNTLERALQCLLGAENAEAEPASSGQPDAVRIATAYFNPAGFARVADHLSDVPDVRLLLGADLAITAHDERRRLGESEAAFERRRMAHGLRNMNETLYRERDRLPFNRASGAALRTLVAALNAGNLEVRRYEHAFLHAKAYIVSGVGGEEDAADGIIAGSSNLTAAGMAYNLELNLGRYEPPVVEKAVQWFDELWDEAVPYDLAEVFEEALRPRTPWEIFIRVLWQLYGDEVDEDARIDKSLPLTNFQMHGVARALRLIRDTGGAIVADEVGLGKTFIAGEILDIYRERRQRALLICPASLRDSTWRNFLNRFQVFVECLSFEQLAYDRQLADSQRPYAIHEQLKRPLDEYHLVIVDEAHNYRNPDAPARAAVLRRLLFGQRRDLLLLTATPVNNSLWDLYHLVRFFVRQDAHFADRGILSIRERFTRAMHEDPSNLSPDVLYPIIDATTVKRTRQFVKKHYAGDNIVGPDGRPMPIVFPEPRAISVRYNLDDLLPGFFDHLEEALDPDSADRILFARYEPDSFRIDGSDAEENAQAQAIVGLLRSGLLKRFESSAYAFRRTVEKMIRDHDAFLMALDEDFVVTTAFMRELSADDDAVFEDVLDRTDFKEPASLYDTDRLRATVEDDREKLKILAEETAKVTPDRDPKLAALATTLQKIAEEAANDAVDGIDEVQKRKVLVFSFFKDTVDWIRRYLRDAARYRQSLTCYCDRIVSVSGSDDSDEPSRYEAVQGFAPVSMEAPVGDDADRYDLMISTDVLAEGVNLQQCRHIINYDMPWNPMRLVQRHGRIDRIGSPHGKVFLRTIFPTDRLDRLLKLEQKILDKLAMAAASVGVVAPIEGAAHGKQVFTETRDEIERLLHEDSSLYERGGTASAAQTGEEYRQTLRKALETDREAILALPWKAGSGMARGKQKGVFFCAVIERRTFLRFVPADDAWQMVADEGGIVREVGTCLRMIECEAVTPSWFPAFLHDRVYDFWDAAQQDVLREWMHDTDPANIQPRIRPLNHRVAEFLRAHGSHGIAQERLIRAIEILESPWPRREEMMLKQWFDETGDHDTKRARTIVDQVLETGLVPSVSPPPLPPIELDDIELLCWLALEPHDDRP